MTRPILRWTLIAIVTFIALSLLALWSWGHFARSARGAASHALPVAASATPLDRLIQPLLDAHPAGASAAALLDEAVPAFIVRARSARAAERSLDVQYYIWRHDTTGRLLENELMAAADRGVRVRLLIDDMNVAGRDDELLAMDAHPNLEVRLFNPGRNRGGGLRRALEMGLRFIGFNRRMHNKAWIADNRVAIVGGRNIGDEYFGASADTNFRDTDLLLIGPAVTGTSAIFDRFWNSSEVIPLKALHKKGSHWTPAHFEARRRQWLADAQATPWARALASHEAFVDQLVHGTLTLHWSKDIHVLSDPPEKAAALASHRDQAGWMLYDISALLFSAKHQSWLISPYFVPGESGTLLLVGQARRGMNVRVLTNSLAANDVPMVHAGYTAYRKRLLRQGVKLYELKPGQSDTSRELFGSSGASLHSKAFVVDGERGFVGSFNLDPRSAQLNTEMGVIFDSPGLARDLTTFFERSVAPDRAWRVSIDADGHLHWHGADGRVHDKEPDTGVGLRLLVRVMGWLPIESQL